MSGFFPLKHAHSPIIAEKLRRREMRHIPVARIIAAIMLIMAGGIAAADVTAASVEGRWLTDDGAAVVTIGHCGQLLCGRISKVLDTAPDIPKTDINNPEVELRSRPIVGLPILTSFRHEGRKWTGGRAYDPKTGESYRSGLELNGDGSLKVTGCVLIFCQSRRWTRLP